MTNTPKLTPKRLDKLEAQLAIRFDKRIRALRFLTTNNEACELLRLARIGMAATTCAECAKTLKHTPSVLCGPCGEYDYGD